MNRKSNSRATNLQFWQPPWRGRLESRMTYQFFCDLLMIVKRRWDVRLADSVSNSTIEKIEQETAHNWRDPGQKPRAIPPKHQKRWNFIRVFWPAMQAHLTWQRSDDNRALTFLHLLQRTSNTLSNLPPFKIRTYIRSDHIYLDLQGDSIDRHVLHIFLHDLLEQRPIFSNANRSVQPPRYHRNDRIYSHAAFQGR